MQYSYQIQLKDRKPNDSWKAFIASVDIDPMTIGLGAYVLFHELVISVLPSSFANRLRADSRFKSISGTPSIRSLFAPKTARWDNGKYLYMFNMQITHKYKTYVTNNTFPEHKTSTNCRRTLDIVPYFDIQIPSDISRWSMQLGGVFLETTRRRKLARCTRSCTFQSSLTPVRCWTI